MQSKLRIGREGRGKAVILYEHQHSAKKDYFKSGRTPRPFSAHFHQSYEYITVVKGRVTISLNGQNFILDPGDCMLILPRQIHAMYGFDENEIAVDVSIFSTDYLPDLPMLAKDVRPRYPILDRALCPPTAECLRELKDSKFYLKSRIYELAAVYLSGDEWTDSNLEPDVLAERFIDYITTHFTEPLTLRGVACELGYNYSYLSHTLNRILGVSFSSLVSEYRMTLACRLLAETDMSIIGIGEECGCNSLRSFNRNFKLFTGLTPREYRKSRNAALGDDI